jgi:hypothetical protein
MRKTQLIWMTILSAMVLLASCEQQSSDKRTSRPTDEGKENPGFLDSTEQVIAHEEGGTVTLGRTTVSFPKDSTTQQYRVRLSRSTTAPELTAAESAVLGSPESDIVKVEVYDASSNQILSADQLSSPYEFKQSFSTGSATEKLGLMVVSESGTANETRQFLPNSELRITEGAALRLSGERDITVTVSLKLTNAVVWLVTYESEAISSLTIGTASGAVVSALAKLVAKPGDEVGITGTNIHSRLAVEIEGKPVAVFALSSTSGKFTMPDVRAGLVTVAVKEGSTTVKSLGLVSDSAGDNLPIMISVQASEICSDKQFRNASGTVVQGTRNCTIPVDCDSDGSVGCVSTNSFPAADLTGLANKILSGETVAGVPGAASGGSGATASDVWNIRAGATVAGVTGKLKVNCRNGINSSIYNYDGAIGSIDGNSVATGTSRDPWDTIDDYNNGGAILSVFPNANLPGTWTADNFCGGIEASANDSNVWKDVTSGGGCATNTTSCRFQDKISGLQWSKLISASRTWPQALNDCDTLTHDSLSDWRLPTQKELMDAYSHGIRSAGTTNWLTSAEMNNYFWSASSVSYATNFAWYVNLSNGTSYNINKTSTNYVVCVR